MFALSTAGTRVSLLISSVSNDVRATVYHRFVPTIFCTLNNARSSPLFTHKISLNTVENSSGPASKSFRFPSACKQAFARFSKIIPGYIRSIQIYIFLHPVFSSTGSNNSWISENVCRSCDCHPPRVIFNVP